MSPVRKVMKGGGLLAISCLSAVALVSVAVAVPSLPESHQTDGVNVRDFGAKGDVAQLVLASPVASGASQVTVTDAGQARSGETVGSLDLPKGTVITNVSGNILTLSNAFMRPQLQGFHIDIGGTDDAHAVENALRYACKTHERLLFPGGRYYMSSLASPCSDVAVQLDRASIAFQSAGLPGVADQSQAMVRSVQTLAGQIAQAGTENIQYLSGVFQNTGQRASYQHNVQSVVGWNSDPYIIDRRSDGGLDYHTHDAVTQYLSMTQDPANTTGNSWVWNHVLDLKQGSNGSSIIGEAQIINDRTTRGNDFDGINTVAGYDEIYDCKSECLYAHFFQGRTPGGRPALTNGLIFRHGTVANMDIGQLTAAIPNQDGVTLAEQHKTDWGIYSSGLGFFNQLHVGGGQALGDSMPTGGLTVDEKGSLASPSILTSFLNATLALNLGSSVGQSAPFLQFTMQKTEGSSTAPSVARWMMPKPGALAAQVEG
ncbi:hypothetical protein, partial [Acetobacter sp.]|uniref:hypothetical protein n=1 Tax=Acetobacter sp. TaxID=440 RepID=UPI0039ED3192